MDAKGTAVKTIPAFVKSAYPHEYFNWIESLPQISKEIMLNPIMATDWFSATDAIIIPTTSIAEKFFNYDIKKAAWQLGRYSSDIALKGIYKIFIKITTPGFILSRASSMLETYYRPCTVKVVESKERSATVLFSGFPPDTEVIFYRIGGWAENTFEAVKCKNVSITFDFKYNTESKQVMMYCKWEQ